MYRTINKVFHGSGGSSSKKKHGKTDSAAAAATAAVAAQELRPDSPLRLGSPSVAAIGEATLRKAIRRIFHSDSIPLDGVSGVSSAVPPPPWNGKGTGPRGFRRPDDVPTEMLAFEIGTIMRRMLEIYDSMTEKMLSSLRSNLQAPGVVTLISNDLRILWALAGYEKQQELGVVAARVAVLGRKCNDVRLRQLGTLFMQLDNPEASFKSYAVSPNEAEILMRFMREQAEATNTLKSEMESLQLVDSRIQEYGEWSSLQEMVTQGKLVEKLQGHCLWAYSLDYLVQLLTVGVCTLRKRIFASFGHGACPPAIRRQSLGEAGLALHYANIVVLLERIIQQPDAVLGPSRDELYDMLPRSIQYLLRVQLQDPLNFTSDGRVEANLKRGLLLLPTMAHNTIHWHSLHTPGAPLDSAEMVFKVQTFYYANQHAVNAALVDVLLGLCRICGVENPIGFVSVQSAATADYSQVVTKSLEEEEKAFRKKLGIEERDDVFGGQVFKVEDERIDRRKKSRDGEESGGKEDKDSEGHGVGSLASPIESSITEVDESFIGSALSELSRDDDVETDDVESVGSSRRREDAWRNGAHRADSGRDRSLNNDNAYGIEPMSPASSAGGGGAEDFTFFDGSSGSRTSSPSSSSASGLRPEKPKGSKSSRGGGRRAAAGAFMSEDFSRRKDKEDPIAMSRSVKASEEGQGSRSSSSSSRMRHGSSRLGQVPRQASADAAAGTAGHSHSAIVGGSHSARHSSSGGVGSSLSQRWSFGKPKSFRYVVEGEGGSGDGVGGEGGEGGSEEAAWETSSLRRALPAGGLVGCFTGAGATMDDDDDEDGDGQDHPRSSRTRRMKSAMIRSHMRAHGGEGSEEGQGRGQEGGGSRLRKTRHYYSQPLPQMRKKGDL